ncbi:MAG: hypothetical protein DRP45_11250 [Candidatus Zixiibacteriota bacterium]|nr:MAG: hypothetical protein DRP45_11250 [candidate division Zixibacteria bacterium]
MVEILVVILIAVLAVVAYLGKIWGWHEGFVFSTSVSLAVVILIFASLIWILVRTLMDKLVGRRIVFLYVGIAITLPLFMSIEQEIVISDEVQAIYDELEQLQPGSKVLVSLDYDPASAPELQPMAEAFFGECFKRDLKLIIMGLWPMGPQQANQAIDTIMARMGLDSTDVIYGEDYVNLGFQAGNEFVIQRMGSSFEAMFGTDYRGTPYQDLPLVRNVNNFSNIDFSYNISAGFPGTVEWVQIAVDRFGLRLAAGNTAVQAPTVYPYLRAGQLVGLMGGMSGGAEFEKLTHLEGKATTYMLSQSFSHIIVIGFIIIGNVAFFRSGRKSGLKE